MARSAIRALQMVRSKARASAHNDGLIVSFCENRNALAEPHRLISVEAF